MHAMLGPDHRQLGPRTASARRLDPNLVFDRTLNTLLAAEISFGCLNGNVCKQKLDLLQVSSSRMTKSGTRPAKVMPSELHNPCFRRNRAGKSMSELHPA